MRQVMIVAAIVLVAGAGVLSAENRTDPGYQPPGLQGPATEAGTDDCPGAPIPGPLPFNDSGDTCTATNTVTTYGGTCTLPYPYGGEDMVYELTVGTGNSVGFSMDLTDSLGDLVLFIISTCGDGNSCVVNSQDAIGPGVGPEIIDPAGYASGTYYVYVDSY